jgi:hypothetical protein
MDKLDQIFNFLRRVTSWLSDAQRLTLFFNFFGDTLIIRVDFCAKPSPLEARESIVVYLREASEGTRGCAGYLEYWLVDLINEGLNLFFFLKVEEVPKLFKEFLELN